MRSLYQIIILLLIFTSSVAQDENNNVITDQKILNHYVWGSLGIGPSYNEGGKFLFINYAATYLYKDKIALMFDFYGLSLGNVQYNLGNFENYTIALGIIKNVGTKHALILFAGPSFGKGEINGEIIEKPKNSSNTWNLFSKTEYEIIPYNSNGIFINGKYLLRGRNFGVGGGYYVNIHRYTDHGFNFTFHFGVLNN